MCHSVIMTFLIYMSHYVRILHYNKKDIHVLQLVYEATFTVTQYK